MKVFLDECVDWRLARDIVGHDVRTARQMGWTTIRHGELLTRIINLLAAIDRALPGAAKFIAAN